MKLNGIKSEMNDGKNTIPILIIAPAPAAGAAQFPLSFSHQSFAPQ
jgi:hypothetical protein